LIFDRAKFDQDFGFSDWLTCLPHLLNLSLYRHRHRYRDPVGFPANTQDR
jgi:hypothetical protein